MKDITRKFFSAHLLLFIISLFLYILLCISNKFSTIDIDILNSLSISISYLSLVASFIFEIISRNISYKSSLSKFEWFIIIILILNFLIRLIFIDKYGSDIANFAKAQISMSLIISFYNMSISK